MQDVVFEQISAFGTVGLSTGLTPELSLVGRLWIIVTMFVGRLGPLTLALSMFTRRQAKVQYPEGRIMIG
jgi:trk system potassium uptake protein TrkH